MAPFFGRRSLAFLPFLLLGAIHTHCWAAPNHGPGGRGLGPVVLVLAVVPWASTVSRRRGLCAPVAVRCTPHSPQRRSGCCCRSMGGAQSSSGWAEGSREGELAIITGGAAGIGYGVAEKCVHLGACAPTAS